MKFRQPKLVNTLVIYLLCVPAFAQSVKGIEVVVGKSMGDYQLQNLINHPTTTAPLSSFKNKLIILDFWSTNCGACIDSWPKLLKLQNDFADRIQIILVNTHQDESIVRSIFQKRKKLASVDVTLPTVCGDTTLSAMFPRMGVPHVVWIDSCQVVRSITYGTSLNAQNIEKMLVDPSHSMRQKQTHENDITWTPEKPMFVESNAGDGEGILYHSVLSTHVQGLFYNEAIIGNPRTGRYTKIAATNVSRERLYALAYTFETRPDGLPVEVYPNRILFQDDKTKEQFSGYVNSDISTEDMFCYELQTDSLSATAILALMRSDLQRFFGHHVQVKKKKVDVYELTILDPSIASRPAGKKFAQGINESQFKVNGAYSMYQVTRSLRELYYTSPYPVVDATNYQGNLYNIDLMVNTKDPIALDAALRQYGLAFTLVKREIPMIFISDPVRTGGSSN